MKPHILVIPLLASTLLSACFMSEEPRVVTGTLFARGPVAFCSPEDPPCRIGVPSGDGYVLTFEEDGNPEEVSVRFEPLTEVGGVPVYLGEAELREEGEVGWIYLVARPTNATVEGAPRFEIAMPDCADMGDEDSQRSGIVRADSTSCTVTDIAGFRAFLKETYVDEFADPAWWSGDN
jgi:hypothetical protein